MKKKLVTTLSTLVCTLSLFSLLAACGETDKQTTLNYDVTDGTCTVTGGTVVDEKLDIPSSYNGQTVTDVGNSAFKDNLTITSATIPEGVTQIGQDAFYGCRNLESVTIPASVTSIGTTAFYNCSKLMNIYYEGDLASWCAKTDLSGIMRYGNAQKSLHIDGSKIEGTLTIPDGVTSIGKAVFYHCNGVTEISFPTSLTKIGDWAFTECPDLTEVSVSNGITSLGERVFSFCPKLASVTYNSATVPKYTFQGCKALTSVTFGTNVTTVDENAFGNCTALTEITLPQNLTSIYSYVFSGCTGLTQITIHSKIKRIYAYAFVGCGALNSVTFEPTSGWKAKDKDDKNWLDVSENITDPETAAKYLRTPHSKNEEWEGFMDREWYRI